MIVFTVHFDFKLCMHGESKIIVNEIFFTLSQNFTQADRKLFDQRESGSVDQSLCCECELLLSVA